MRNGLIERPAETQHALTLPEKTNNFNTQRQTTQARPFIFRKPLKPTVTGSKLRLKKRKLVVFPQDNGEGRRLGTLVVWLDEGIENDEPLLAVPINLSVLLDLPQDQVCVWVWVSCERVRSCVRAQRGRKDG